MNEDFIESYQQGIIDALLWLYNGCFDDRFSIFDVSPGDVFEVLDKCSLYTPAKMKKLAKQISKIKN